MREGKPSGRAAAVIAIAVAGLGLAACSSVGLSSLNPFKEKERTLPGEREAVFAASEVVPSAGGGTASIGAPKALDDWPAPGGPPDNDPGHVAVSLGSGWRADVGRFREIRLFANPIVSGGRVYVYDPSGTVTALSLGGATLWKRSLRPEGERSDAQGGGVAAEGGRIFAATGFGTLAALDGGNGDVLWSRTLQTPPRSAPTAAGGRVYVVSSNDTVYAFSAADGEQLWAYGGMAGAAGLLSTAAPAVSGSTVVAPTTSGEIVALDSRTGNALWSDTVVRAARFSAVSGISDTARPVISDGVVYATGVGGRLIAVSLRSGQRVWEANVGSASTPTVSGDAIFLIDLSERVMALSRKDGSIIWLAQLPAGDRRRPEVWVGPRLAGGKLWLASSRGRLASVDPATGQIEGYRELGGSSALEPIAAAGKLIVVSGDGRVTAL